MSRYFQSSYHGSNDYKKYREERLGKNIDSKVFNDKKSVVQDFSYRPQARRNNPKENLQTFGKQISSEQSNNHNLYREMNLSHRQTDRLKRQQTSKYDGSSFLPKKELNNEFCPAKHQEDKLSRYMKDNYGADKRLNILNEDSRLNTINASQTNQSSIQNLRHFERYSRPEQSVKNNQVSDDFEDSIITRRRNYDNSKDFGCEGSYLDTSSKVYNYSSKIKNRARQAIDQKPFESKQRGNSYAVKFEEKYKINSDLIEKNPSTSPYRSRNQIIKERITINQNSQQFVPYRSLRHDFDSINEPPQSYSTKRQFTPSQIRTTNVTPEKSLLTSRQHKNASQQRRKSLIQKSQMLKEKLNKLNGLSNKKNAENQQKMFGSSANQKQNIAQNYTPKRYTTNSFRFANENSEKVDRSISKKLNFEEATKKGQPLITFDKNSNEERQSYKNKYKNSVIASGTKEAHGGETTGEGALRKISQLNERINSRLESILKNYG